ncbi:MAG: right-handed parallel beta-helix repeat-containing protein [Thermoguttaceae bacterium]|jgi:hypothetical protein
MATLFFNNTADSGSGSLRAALAAAESGDAIMPDPTVFARGERPVVNLSSMLLLKESATLLADATRPRVSSADGIALFARDGESLVVEGWEFVGRVMAYHTESNFSRCLFAGNAELAMAIQGKAETSITLEDCVVTGARRGGIYASGADSTLKLVRTTVAGNFQPVEIGTQTEYTAVDSIVDPVPSEAGFAAPPPDEFPDDGSALSWEEWNLAPLPDSPFASGATTAEGRCDFLGVPRGRVVDGETLYAAGALEVIEADYWFTGVGGSFLDAANWRTTRAGSATPETIEPGVFFIDENARWSDAPPEGSTLIIAGRVATTLGANAALDAITIGDDAAMIFEGRDRIVSVADGSKIILGPRANFVAAPGSSGYLAVAGNAELSNALFDGIVVAGYGANLTSFEVATIRPRTALFEWTATNPNATIRLEGRTPEGWTELAPALDAAETGFEATVGSGRATFRAFDGEKFLYDDAWSFSGVQLSVVATAAPAERAGKAWEAITTMAKTSDPVMVGQGITILARIYDAFDVDAPLLSNGSNIESVAYSCRYVSNGIFDETLEPVPGHEEVDAGTDCVLEALQTCDAWTVDDVGYSFALTPNVRDAPLFDRPGRYQIKVVVRLVDGNPATFYVPVDVMETSTTALFE